MGEWVSAWVREYVGAWVRAWVRGSVMSPTQPRSGHVRVQYSTVRYGVQRGAAWQLSEVSVLSVMALTHLSNHLPAVV